MTFLGIRYNGKLVRIINMDNISDFIPTYQQGSFATSINYIEKSNDRTIIPGISLEEVREQIIDGSTEYVEIEVNNEHSITNE